MNIKTSTGVEPPDWGPPGVETHHEHGPILNAAAVLEWFREGGTKECRIAYMTACVHWHLIKDDPDKTLPEKQLETIRSAISSVEYANGDVRLAH